MTENALVSEGDLVREKLRALITLSISVVVFSAWAAAPNDASPLKALAYWIGVFVFNYLAFRWCRLDAAQHSVRLWPRFALLLIAFPGPIVMMPMYFIFIRRKQQLISLVYFLLFATLLMILCVIPFLLIPKN